MDTRHLVDREIAPLIDLFPRVDLEAVPIEQVRAKAAETYGILPPPAITPEEIMVTSIHGGPDIPVYLFRPEAARPGAGAILHIDGGGMVMGSVKQTSMVPAALAAAAGVPVASVEYRLAPEHPFPAPQQVLATDEAALRTCGFSGTKLATIRGIAQAALDGVVPTREQALSMPDEALIDRLVTLRGVGRWTVEMLLIYTLERSDILPADDFGVRDGYRRLKRLDTTPTRKQMETLGLAWSPYRTVAAWYLWRVPVNVSGA